MASNKKKQDDKLLNSLRIQAQLPFNKQCFDCSQKGPTYVNTTIGSFVCTKCSGLLRGLTPAHRVKSISMATFTAEEIEFIKNRGNDFCRSVWLAKHNENHLKNVRDEQTILDFMIAKYENKLYYMEPSKIPVNGPIKEQEQMPKKVVNRADVWDGNDGRGSWSNNNSISSSGVTAWSSHPNTTVVRPPPIQASTMNLTATTNMFTPDRPDTFNFPPVSDVFGPAPASSSIPSSQVFFADFDNNPVFNSPTPAPLQALSTSTSFPTGLRQPAEDKYAALKALDSMMKMQSEPTPSSTKTNGSEWAPTPAVVGINPFTELVSAEAPPTSPFNPFRNSTDNSRPAHTISTSYSMNFPAGWNNSGDLTVGATKSGNPFL